MSHTEFISTGIESIDTILGGGLPKGGTVLLHGDPGVGTSMLLAHIAASLLGKVVYITGEQTEEELLDRLKMVSDGRGIDADILSLRGVEPTQVAVAELVEKACGFDLRNAKLMILDIATRDLTDAEDQRHFFELIVDSAKKTGCPVIINTRSPRPGSRYEYAADAIMAMDRAARTWHADPRRIVWCTKNRHAAVGKKAWFCVAKQTGRLVQDGVTVDDPASSAHDLHLRQKVAGVSPQPTPITDDMATSKSLTPTLCQVEYGEIGDSLYRFARHGVHVTPLPSSLTVGQRVYVVSYGVAFEGVVASVGGDHAMIVPEPGTRESARRYSDAYAHQYIISVMSRGMFVHNPDIHLQSDTVDPVAAVKALSDRYPAKQFGPGTRVKLADSNGKRLAFNIVAGANGNEWRLATDDAWGRLTDPAQFELCHTPDLELEPVSAAWRVGATQTVEAIKAALVAGTRTLSSADMKRHVASLVNSKYGDAAIAAMVSAAISVGAPSGGKLARLAEELRVKAMTDASNEAIGSLVSELSALLDGGKVATIIDSIELPPPEPAVHVDFSKEKEAAKEKA